MLLFISKQEIVTCNIFLIKSGAIDQETSCYSLKLFS